jgi:hypothetical protein
MGWWLAEFPATVLARKLLTRVLPNMHHLPRSRIAICTACEHRVLILALGEDEEFHVCLRCRANLRYRMLAGYLRGNFRQLPNLEVLELDPASPLRRLLSGARSYMRSFYMAEMGSGIARTDGAIHQDITRLGFADNSLDLIISSDVLEHVPDVAAAFRESARVLRRGGVHLFTVPPRPATVRRASIEGAAVRYWYPAEYHRDPLSVRGILAFWDFGPDLPQQFAQCGLEIRVVAGPQGRSGRVIWEARK